MRVCVCLCVCVCVCVCERERCFSLLLEKRVGGKMVFYSVVKVVLRVSLQDRNGSLHLSPKVTYVSMCVWSFASLGWTLGWVSSHSAWFRPFPWWLLWAGDFQVTQSLKVKRHIHAYTHALRQLCPFGLHFIVALFFSLHLCSWTWHRDSNTATYSVKCACMCT